MRSTTLGLRASSVPAPKKKRAAKKAPKKSEPDIELLTDDPEDIAEDADDDGDDEIHTADLPTDNYDEVPDDEVDKAVEG